MPNITCDEAATLINEAASLWQAARTEGELYKGENRRKNRRALS